MIAADYPFLGTQGPSIVDSARPGRSFRTFARLIRPEERLQVVRVEFGSPGFKDIAGIGAVVKAIAEFIARMIELRAGKRKRQLEELDLEAKIRAQEIKNARDFIKLDREFQEHRRRYPNSSLTERQLEHLVQSRIAPMSRLIEDGKIRNAQLVEAKAVPESDLRELT